MPKVKAPASLRVYRASGAPRDGLERLVERLAARKFRPLDDAVEETERFGWTTQEHLLDTAFDVGKCVREPFFLFALRIDKRRVPQNLVRAHVRMAEQARFAASGKKLTASERRDLRDDVARDLAAKTLPVAQSFPVFWAPARRRVYFGSTSERPNEIFRAWFEDTFEIAMVPQDAAGLAEALAAGNEAALARIASLAPTTFGATTRGDEPERVASHAVAREPQRAHGQMAGVA